jgi:hypothetical protein
MVLDSELVRLWRSRNFRKRCERLASSADDYAVLAGTGKQIRLCPACSKDGKRERTPLIPSFSPSGREGARRADEGDLQRFMAPTHVRIWEVFALHEGRVSPAGWPRMPKRNVSEGGLTEQTQPGKVAFIRTGDEPPRGRAGEPGSDRRQLFRHGGPHKAGQFVFHSLDSRPKCAN